MDTNQRLTWEEIVARYPNQWVFIAEPETEVYPDVINGIILAAAPTKKQLYELLLPHAPITGLHCIKYTGIISQPDHRWRNVFILEGHQKIN